MSTLYNKYYDISKLVIWGDETGDDTNRKAKLIFSFRDGNPRITVYTGVVGKEGVISFPSDHPTMVTIMNLLKDVANGQPGVKFSIDSLTFVYENDKPTTNKRIVSTLHIGKSNQGLVYFSVIMEAKPKLVFTLKSSPFHAFRDKDKNLLSEESISSKMALGLADLILGIVSNIIVNYTDEEYDNSPRKPLEVKGRSGVNPQVAVKENIQELDDLAL